MGTILASGKEQKQEFLYTFVSNLTGTLPPHSVPHPLPLQHSHRRPRLARANGEGSKRESSEVPDGVGG